MDNLGLNSSAATIRPPHDISPDHKDFDWHLQFAKFIYGSCREKTASNATRASYLRGYANGQQSTSIYKQLLGYGDDKDAPDIPFVRTNDQPPEEDDSGTSGTKFMDVNDEEIFSPASKFLMVLSGIMEGQEHSVVVKALNEYATSDREGRKHDLWYKMKFGKWERQMMQQAGMEVPEEDGFVPASIHELQILEDSGHLKLPYEIAIEKGIQDYKEISDFEEEYRQFMRDLFTLNDGAVHDFYDDNIGRCRFKRIDTSRLFMEIFEAGDSSKASFAGYIENVTIVDIRNATGWSEDKIQALATAHSDKYGNHNEVLDSWENYGSKGTANYDDFLIPVLNCFFKTTDSKFYQKRKTSNGTNKEFEEKWRSKTKPPKQKKGNGREMYREDLRTIHECKWVIDSEEMYDWGVMDNLPFDYGERDVDIPIFRQQIPGKSIVENMIPMLDQLMLAFLKWQNNLAKAAPPGLAIELSSFMNLTFDNKEWSVMDIINLRQQTGILTYKLQTNNVPGAPGSQSILPYAELKGGAELATKEFVMAAEVIYGQLAEVTGIDRFTSASQSPEPRQAVGVVQAATASTLSTLKPYYAKWVTIQKSMYRSAANRIQHLVALNEGQWDFGYMAVLGENLYQILKMASVKNPVIMGLSIRPAPTAEMKQKIEEAAGAALNGGNNGVPAITLSEYLFITKELMFSASFNSVIAIISSREKEAEEKAAAMQENIPRIQAEEARKTQAAAAQIKEGEVQQKLAELAAKGEEERKTKVLTHQLKLQEITHEKDLEFRNLSLNTQDNGTGENNNS